MRLKNLELNGFKSFAKKTALEFHDSIVSIVGPNGSGKSNVVEALRFVLGEQSMKSMRGSSGSDLIFKGSKSLPKSSRASVTIYFDNSDKVFKLGNDGGESINLNYETISISREVFSDGLNKYILNGEEVRLKDIHNLLSSVNIGSSGHHIISQGGADRILNASAKDRKEIVEDALGLKIYQYKIKESERKLERTENNMKEVSLLRRENAPHLNFLKKQVEKLEKAKEMQTELASLYIVYFKNESAYLEKEKNNLSLEKSRIQKEIDSISSQISSALDGVSIEGNKKIEELKTVEDKLNELRILKGEIGRKLGRIEGMIEMEERRKDQKKEIVEISEEEMQNIVLDIEKSIDVAFSKESIEDIRPILLEIKKILKRFSPEEMREDSSVNLEIQKLKESQKEITVEMGKLTEKEKEMTYSIELLKQEINKEMESLRERQKEEFALKVKHQELASSLNFLKVREENLARETLSFENEVKEGVALAGSQILSYKDSQIEVKPLSVERGERDMQEESRKKIERIKIKLEDAGLGNGAELMKEFKEVTERDQFLAKEMEDLTKSMESLLILIADLKDKIDIEFKEGVKKVNVEFSNLFSLMFDGGSAHLSIVVNNKNKRSSEEDLDGESEDDSTELSLEAARDDSVESGIEINVSLPHKKVKELDALSGGERSLTSIALLFAMSQVNPPPFLVLDETDAALDEANSRKYGDMLEKLSYHSQLIVVTHNRETMSRAGILYGVTVGSDGASKLLSVKLEEATQIAK